MSRLAAWLVVFATFVPGGQSPGPVPVPGPAPSPAPVTPPTPVPVPAPQVVPHAVLTGSYWAASGNTPGGGTGTGNVLGMFVLDASASTSTPPIKWSATGPPVSLIVSSPEGGTVKKSLAQAYPTQVGTYTFKAVARGVTDGEPDADAAVWTYTITAAPQPGPAPSPTPVPIPVPTPVPVPPTPTPTPPSPIPPPPTATVTKPLYVTLVVDATTMTQSLASIRDSVTIASSLSSQNAHWLTLDVASPEYSRRNLAAAVKSAGGAPCLIIQGSPVTPGGPYPIISATKAPADEAALLTFLKSVGSLVGGN